MFKTSRSILNQSINIYVIKNRPLSTHLNDVPAYDAQEPKCDTNTRLLNVSIIGVPNAGKSTFINKLMDRKVCPTSSKVHTTRGKSLAIFTQSDAQIVFIDTPGVVNDREQKKFNLEKTFARDCKTALKKADIIGVIHDVGNIWTRERLDIKIIKMLEYQNEKPSFLVLNKIDALKSKRKLLDITRQVTENCIDGNPIPGGKAYQKNEESKGWPNFSDIFMVSSLTGDGLQEVKDYLVKKAKLGEWPFPHEAWTDQSPETFIVNTIQAKFLDFLPQEIPYQLTPILEYYAVDEDGIISAVVTVKCPSERIAKLVAGAADGRLKQINESVQYDLQQAFQNFVKIRLVLESKYVKKEVVREKRYF